jgi:ATP-dependent helicase/nuclease subunit A
MASRREPLARLEGDQLAASSPLDHAALSASAGTGKTHVLTARVLRLLLAGVDPGSILCLTFTKAGAAEMAERIHERLAYWVRLEDKELRKELFALEGERVEDAQLLRARTLFAAVLDAPGGGLRIQTIHAFAQSLLAAFPAEASLTPGFRPLEGREEQELARATLAELLVRAESTGDAGFIRDAQLLSHRLGEAAAEAFLLRCGRAIEAMQALGAREGIDARLRRALGVPAGDVEQIIADECCDEAFDVLGLRRIAQCNRQWNSNAGLDRAGLCERWLAGTPAERAGLLEQLHSVWARKDGELRSFSRGQAPADEAYAALAAAAFECCARLLTLRRTAAYVAALAAALRAGQTFALAYAQAKRSAGVVDFDDLIRASRALLMADGMGDWVRFKLDQSTDHILVDEAQDTNDDQWDIVRALTLEYFAGEGASEGPRTIFTVGDFKQAIFGFQGTDPQSFDRAVAWFRREAEGIDASFLDLSIERNFRSSPPILALVDQLLMDLGHDALGLSAAPRTHVSHHATRPGLVTLWKAFSVEDGDEADEAAGEEGWISDSLRLYAARLAGQIRQWLDHPFPVGKDKHPLQPQDILILVRRRSQLASLLVARLHEEGVPVAGVDRLLLSAPLAVQDLLAAARFAMQPLDDLNLASLLVSPLLGWSQEELFEISHGREGHLWPRLRATDGLLAAAAVEQLGQLLAMADFATPHQFFETILSGPMEGRRKLLGRLGSEARDPIEELLASALQFEQHSPASLQRFLDWFARGDVEIVRDPSAPTDAVRVMTVHGSKGLQAPVVILADACVDPERSGNDRTALLELDDASIPIIRPRKGELVEPLKSQLYEQARRERQEHWRLLYVALTRAEERLYVGGALGPADRNGPPGQSWYAAVERALQTLDCEWQADPLWAGALGYGSVADTRSFRPPAETASFPFVPPWLHRPAPPEARPPRPLVPSAMAEDQVPQPPPGPAMRAAAERGRLLHQLFERLPAVPPEDRVARAEAWLAHSAGVEDGEVRRTLVGDAQAVLSDPRFADIFSPDSLAEAPIAAVTPDGSVISGTVDRLHVTDERIRVVDFKTGQSVPRSDAEIAVPHLRQMAAYVAALNVIFPGRAIEAALLYTAGPMLFPLPEALLAPHLPGAKLDG